MIARRALLATCLALCCIPLAASAQQAKLPLADLVLVEKAAHRLTLFADGRRLRTYRVALGQGGLGPKQRQGDGKVPEGVYKITGGNPYSAYHLSLRISYPTPAQRAAAARRGVDPGGDIMIHGLPNGQSAIGAAHVQSDWTLGCIAVTNREIEEIWDMVPDGTTIEIRP